MQSEKFDLKATYFICSMKIIGKLVIFGKKISDSSVCIYYFKETNHGLYSIRNQFIYEVIIVLDTSLIHHVYMSGW